MLERARRELGSVIRLYTFRANTVSRRFYERHGFRAVAFSDGHTNEERCPDVLYELDRNAQQLSGRAGM
jgi:RimJ/RimL family protein N-acetyltransferase